MKEKLQKIRWLIIAILISFFGLESFAQDVAYSKGLVQNAQQENQKAQTLADVLKKFEADFGINFMFDPEVIKGKKVEVSTLTGGVENQLESILKPLSLSFKKIDKNYYVIQPASKREIRKIDKKSVNKGMTEGSQSETVYHLNSLSASLLAAKAPIKVSGKVTSSEDGEGLPGVNVLVKGTIAGTTTDASGNYSLVVPNENAVLVFSFVGFTSEEVTVSTKSIINVALVPDVAQLSEVVVVGYGTQKRSDLTGSISSVRSKEIQNIAAKSVAEALQGRAAGVLVTRNDGKPGSDSKIVIRGAGSINGLDPLWIVDGVRMGTGNNFNIRDIESIEILKDAGSAAIYGSQAAGGVVLVTTKRGKTNEKLTVDFTAQVGKRQGINLIDNFLTTPEYIRARQGLGENQASWSDPSVLPNTDWLDEMYSGTGIEQNYNVAVRGGSENVNYYISANYLNEDGISIDSWFKRYGFRANSDYKLGKRIRVGESIYLSKTSDNPKEDDGYDFRILPVVPVYDPLNPIDGKWGFSPSYNNASNIIAKEYKTHHDNFNYNIDGSIYLEADIFAGLKFRSTFGAALGQKTANRFAEAAYWSAGGNVEPDGSLEKKTETWQNLTATYLLTYSKTFGRHDFSVMAGYEALKNDKNEVKALGKRFPVPFTWNMNLAASDVRAEGYPTPDRTLSQFGRITYSFADRYLLAANIRRDESDRFGPNNNTGIFPSVNAGWKLSEENFFQNVPFVSSLKLRGSWGILGGNNIDKYLFLPGYSNERIFMSFDGSEAIRGYSLFRFPNEGIKWEEVRQWNAGLDVGLIEDKLTMSLDVYNRNTEGMLYNVQLPLSAGISKFREDTGKPPVNIGSVTNEGVEVVISWNDQIGDVRYTIGGNASYNTNQLEKLGLSSRDYLTDAFGGTFDQHLTRTQNGYAIGQFYGYVVDGIFASNNEVAQYNQSAKELTNNAEAVYQYAGTAAGDFKYRDIAGYDQLGNLVNEPDGVINEADKTFIGNPWPKWIYGFNLGAEYKGFSLTAFFTGLAGVDIYNATKSLSQNLAQDYSSTTDVFNASFTYDNELTDQPRITKSDPNGNFKNPSSYFIESGTYLKLRNLQFGYTLPKSVLTTLGMQDARVYLSGENLFTITNYSGSDPELGGNIRERGIDRSNFPHTRFYSAGVQISF